MEKTDTDDEDWQALKESVRPLHPRMLKKEKASPLPAKLTPKKAIPKTVSMPPKPVATPVAPLAAGNFDNIDKRTADKVRRGEYPIDATIDLHGMQQTGAFLALEQALLRAARAEQRLLLVITGKGLRSGSGGVLKAALPGWLESPSIRPHLLTFCKAAPKHGGSGAFYVLLKRKRN